MTIIDGKPFTQLTNLNVFDELRVNGVVVKPVPLSPRSFFVQVAGDDTLSGRSFETANATIGQATIGVNGLVPISSPTDPSAIIITGAGTFAENVSLPDGCQFSCPSAFVVAPTGDAFIPGSNAATDILAVANLGTSSNGFLINNLINVGLSCSSLSVVGDNGNGIFVSGTSDDIFINIHQLSVQGLNSVGVRDETTIIGGPSFFNIDQLTLEINNSTGFLYNPLLAATDAILRAGLIGEINGVTGTTGMDILGGRLDAIVNEVVADTAIHVANGATLDLIGNVIEGNIIVDVGGILNCRVISHINGTVTNNGTITGFIGTDHYGNLVFLNDITIAENLLVEGTTTFTNVTNISVADRYINLNAGYETLVAVTAGISANYLPLATNDVVTGGAFVAGVFAISNPTIVTVGSNIFSDGQILQITGTDTGENDGIYEASSHVGTLLTLKGVGTIDDVEDFTRSQLIDNPSDNATIRNITMSIIRTGINGLPEHGLGAITPVTFNPLITGIIGSPNEILFNNAGVIDGLPNVTTTNGDNIQFGDASEALFGDGGDLIIFHDGNFSRITNNTGNLEITNGTGGDLVFKSTSTSNKIINKLGNSTTATSFHVRDVSDADLFVVTGAGNAGFKTNDPKSNVHIQTSGTSGLVFAANRGLVISGVGGQCRLYMEATDAPSGERVFLMQSEAGDLAFNSVSDDAGTTIHGNILSMDHATGHTGFGTQATPDSKVHIFEGSAGVVTAPPNTVLTIENSAASLATFLAPEGSPSGFHFGRPSFNADGGFFFNSSSAPGGFDWRTINISRMTLDAVGNLNLRGDVTLSIGVSNDLQLSHSGTSSSITNATGALDITNNGAGDMVFEVNDVNASFDFILGAAGSSASHFEIFDSIFSDTLFVVNSLGNASVGAVVVTNKFVVQMGATETGLDGILIQHLGTGQEPMLQLTNSVSQSFTMGIEFDDDDLVIAPGVDLLNPNRFIMDAVGRVSIGNTTPDTSAILTLAVEAINPRGFLPPRGPATERDAIPSPATALEFYNETENEPQYFDGTLWQHSSPPTFQILNVRTVADLPAPAAGSHTIPADTTIILSGLLDLGANNIAPLGNLNVFGFGNFNSSLTSTNAAGTIDLGTNLGAVNLTNLIIDNTNAASIAVAINNAGSSLICERINVFADWVIGDFQFVNQERVSHFDNSIRFTSASAAGTYTASVSAFIQTAPGPVKFIEVIDGASIAEINITFDVLFITDTGGTGIVLESPDSVARGFLDQAEFLGAGTFLACEPQSGSNFAPTGLGDLRGIAIDNNGDLIIVDSDAVSPTINLMTGLANPVQTTIVAPATTPRGVVWAKGNLISSDPTANTIYVHDGFSTTITTSFAAPAGSVGALTFDGTNLISIDTVTDLVYIHDGISATILRTFSTPAVPASGITFDGVNLIVSDQANTVHVLDGITGTLQYSFAGPGTTVQDMVETDAGFIISDITDVLIYLFDHSVTFDHSSPTWEIKGGGGQYTESSDRGGSNFVGAGTTITITTQNIYVDIAATGIAYGTFSTMEKCRLNIGAGISPDGESTGEVFWTGSRDVGRVLSGVITITRGAGGASDITYELAVSINGIIQSDSIVQGVLSTTSDFATIQTLPVTRDLKNGDLVKLQLRNTFNTQDPDVSFCKLAIN